MTTRMLAFAPLVFLAACSNSPSAPSSTLADRPYVLLEIGNQSTQQIVRSEKVYDFKLDGSMECLNVLHEPGYQDLKQCRAFTASGDTWIFWLKPL